MHPVSISLFRTIGNILFDSDRAKNVLLVNWLFSKRGADNSGLVNGAVKIQIPTNKRIYQGHSNKQHQTSSKNAPRIRDYKKVRPVEHKNNAQPRYI
jgi:hypothetical protein